MLRQRLQEQVQTSTASQTRRSYRTTFLLTFSYTSQLKPILLSALLEGSSMAWKRKSIVSLTRTTTSAHASPICRIWWIWRIWWKRCRRPRLAMRGCASGPSRRGRSPRRCVYEVICTMCEGCKKAAWCECVLCARCNDGGNQFVCQCDPVQAGQLGRLARDGRGARRRAATARAASGASCSSPSSTRRSPCR